MRRKTPKVVALAVLLLLFGACQPQEASLTTCLINASNSSDVSESYTAMLLLAHMSLSAEAQGALEERFSGSENATTKLLLAYVLAVRTQQTEYVDSFIALYPQGAQQRQVWELAESKTDYISVSSPLQQLLAEYAMTNDVALEKLVSGLGAADGAHAESLIDELARIHEYHPERVATELSKQGLSVEELGLKPSDEGRN